MVAQKVAVKIAPAQNSVVAPARKVKAETGSVKVAVKVAQKVAAKNLPVSKPTAEKQERGNDAEHFNLWDDGQPVLQGTPVKLSGRSDDAGPVAKRVVSGRQSAPSPVTWTTDDVLRKCQGYKWPEWVKDFRDSQVMAVSEILNLYEAGKKIVVLDAPTGAGKTLIGEMVRVCLGEAGVKEGPGRGARGVYVCSGLQLQDQFARDFPDAKVLKGRGNYRTENMPFPEYTAADCVKEPGDSKSCLYCSDTRDCPYEVSKREAVSAQLAVLNTTYLLYEANHAGKFSRGTDGFAVVDECDMLEDELMRFVEFRMSEAALGELGVEKLKKGVHRATVKTWMDEVLVPALQAKVWELGGAQDEKGKKDLKRFKGLLGDAQRVALTVEDENWVRDYETSNRPPFREMDSFIMRPVTVGREGRGVLWRHAKKWLVMSATVISAEQLAADVGMGSREHWGLVTAPMSFPVENRPIVLKSVAKMTAKTEVEERPKLAKGIKKILELHEGENVLIHTHSYKLTKWLTDELKTICPEQRARIVSYETSRDRDIVLERFKKTGGILLAPSLDRGVDLPDDLCRVMVVAKCPYPYLGDKQISTRIHLPGGNTWYAVKSVRTVVQMTGRGVRHKDDFAVTYILDGSFVGKLWKDNKALFPNWWKEGVTEGTNSVYASNLRRI